MFKSNRKSILKIIMSNKQIVALGIVGFGVFIAAFLGDSNNEGVVYHASLITFWVGVIWAWVRLLKI